VTINWQDITEGYNDKYNTNYTEKQMWQEVYPKNTCFELEKLFMVSPLTIIERLRYCDIKIEPRGRRHPTKLDKFRTIPNHERAKLSLSQLAEITGATTGTVAFYKVRYGGSKKYEKSASKLLDNSTG